jgi:RIO kinase 1
VEAEVFDDLTDEEEELYYEAAPQDPFDEFYTNGLITGVVRVLKSGKEASVHLCRGNPSTGAPLLAVKAFRPREFRSFKKDAVYKDGRVILDRRAARAIKRKSAFGRSADEGWWIHHEYETLQLLHGAGADVPRPIAASGPAILMDYVGDEDEAAPQLRQVSPDAGEARELFDRLMWNVERFLAHNVVHADLSPFNVLYWEGRATIIDLPQAVDARTNQNAHHLLGRDVANLCDYFARFGVRADATALTRDLWTRFILGRL